MAKPPPPWATYSTFFLRSFHVALRRPETYENRGESSATCRGCADSQLVFARAAQPRQVALHFPRIQMNHYRWTALCVLPLLICLSLASPQIGVSGQESSPPYKDPSLPIEKRVDDLVSRMTL